MTTARTWSFIVGLGGGSTSDAVSIFNPSSRPSAVSIRLGDAATPTSTIFVNVPAHGRYARSLTGPGVVRRVDCCSHLQLQPVTVAHTVARWHRRCSVSSGDRRRAVASTHVCRMPLSQAFSPLAGSVAGVGIAGVATEFTLQSIALARPRLLAVVAAFAPAALFRLPALSLDAVGLFSLWYPMATSSRPRRPDSRQRCSSYCCTSNLVFPCAAGQLSCFESTLLVTVALVDAQHRLIPTLLVGPPLCSLSLSVRHGPTWAWCKAFSAEPSGLACSLLWPCLPGLPLGMAR